MKMKTTTETTRAKIKTAATTPAAMPPAAFEPEPEDQISS